MRPPLKLAALLALALLVAGLLWRRDAGGAGTPAAGREAGGASSETTPAELESADEGQPPTRTVADVDPAIAAAARKAAETRARAENPNANAASLEGRVLRPDGKPAASARVHFHVRRRGPAWYEDSTVADEEGRFRLDPLRSGTLKLFASAAGCADSAAQYFQLVEREQREGVLVQLQRFGRLHVHVRGPGDMPEPGRQVVCSDQGTGRALFGSTDGAGNCRFDEVAPGAHVVSSPLSEAELARLSREAPALAGALTERGDWTTVELAEDQSLDVQLGGAIAGGVRLFGCVRSGGDALVGAWIAARDASWTAGVVHARTNEQGRYELWLPGAGRFEIELNAAGGAVQRSFEHAVPEGKEHRLDLELPSASLAGRVVDRARRGVGGRNVRLDFLGPPPGAAVAARPPSWPSVETRGDGSFEFLNLDAGRYELRVQARDGVSDDYGMATSEELAVEAGSRLGGVEIVLSAACVVRGAVRGATGPARVLAWDDRGRQLLQTRTENDGSFCLRGLPEGEVSVAASAGQLSSPPSASLRLEAGREAEVELQLVPGGRLQIMPRGTQGEVPFAGRVCVRDAAGRVHTEIQVELAEAGDAVWTTPLSPGPYQVEFESRDGLRASDTVVVVAGQDARVELTLARPR